MLAKFIFRRIWQTHYYEFRTIIFIMYDADLAVVSSLSHCLTICYNKTPTNYAKVFTGPHNLPCKCSVLTMVFCYFFALCYFIKTTQVITKFLLLFPQKTLV